MALLANDAQERVAQLLLVTERLADLIAQETRRIDAREPPADGAEADERNRLANAYRLELARIKQDTSLVAGATPASLTKLRTSTERLQAALAAHDVSLSAVKTVAEGLVQAMAEEAARLRGGGAGYGANGVMAGPSGPIPTVLDRSA